MILCTIEINIIALETHKLNVSPPPPPPSVQDLNVCIIRHSYTEDINGITDTCALDSPVNNMNEGESNPYVNKVLTTIRTRFVKNVII